MNYKKSAAILREIKKAKKILVNLHQSPDPDSFSSALSLRRVLESFNKKVDVVCTEDSALMAEATFMRGYKNILHVDFNSFDFSKYDLLISPDSANWSQVVGVAKVKVPNIKKIVIDHHITNKGFADLNLIDEKKTSCAEVLQLIFEDWGIDIDAELATLLLVGIIGDTGGFQFAGTARALKPASRLIERGADMDNIMFNLYRNKSFNAVKMIGEFLNTLKIDKESNFSYMSIPYGVYKKYGKPAKISTYVANTFSNMVDDVLFGVTILEFEPNQTYASFRARGDFDVSKISMELGGGGHLVTAAASVRDVPFAEAVDKILKVARKYAKKG